MAQDYSRIVDEGDDVGGETASNTKTESKYVVKVFGTTMEGNSVSVNLIGFRPYFYIRVPAERPIAAFTASVSRYFCGKMSSFKSGDATAVRKKEFHGFQNDEMVQFICLVFDSLKSFRHAISLVKSGIYLPGRSGQGPSKVERFTLYESNIDPILRLLHSRNLKPSGWAVVNRRTYIMNDEDGLLPSTCQIDITCDWSAIFPRHEQERIAPILVASFDLECTSSHGDFPVAQKSYKKTANQLFELFRTEKNKTRLVTELASAFNEPVADGRPVPISRVFFKRGGVSALTAKKNVMLHIDEICRILESKMMVVDGKIVNRPSTSARALMSPAFRCTVKGRGAKCEDEDDEDEDGDADGSEDRTGPDMTKDEVTNILTLKFAKIFPALEGDAIIQIGTTVHAYGEKECTFRHIVTLGTCDAIAGVEVEQCETEVELLLRWKAMIVRLDPDVLIGFNIFGFDMPYLYGRAKELNIIDRFMTIGRVKDKACLYVEKVLSSSALGDNELKYIDMDGRVIIDIMKVVRRDHSLDSYSLDNVSAHFLKQHKFDVSPNMVFRLQKGSGADRRQIAEYCVQDCTLCNKLLMKLEIVANNIGMSNVCSVPLSYIFLRGQGVKIFSLVAKQCRTDGFVIPLLARPLPDTTGVSGKGKGGWGVPYLPDGESRESEDSLEEGYEGAIVLEPREGIYLEDPVSIVDYASLYPSSMISENLSHDSIVLDARYDNLPGVEYLDIVYDVFEGKGDKKLKVGEKTNRFMQPANGEKGTIPRILMHLLQQRQLTRKRMVQRLVVMKDGTELSGVIRADPSDGSRPLSEGGLTHIGSLDGLESNGRHVSTCDIVAFRFLYEDFQKAVLDGLQTAYKVTANSLYGQTGARTSQIYMKEIAACTTATGRRLILEGKKFMEEKYGAETIYGDTDSLMLIFSNYKTVDGERVRLKGKDAIMASITKAIQASKDFKQLLKPPHDLEYEKTFYPMILLSKKRYVANKYEYDDVKFKQSSMGIILKRRDNAPIAKHVYGGVIDIILNKHDLKGSIRFLERELNELVNGRCDLKDLVITKALKSDYANPKTIAHKVLAERMGERDIGTKPQVNDRIPYVHIQVPGTEREVCNMLQGQKIEHIDYVRERNLMPDYQYYITKQIMNPVVQLYALVLEQLDGHRKYRREPDHWASVFDKVLLLKEGNHKKAKESWHKMRNKEVEAMLFDPVLSKVRNKRSGSREITEFFKTVSSDKTSGRVTGFSAAVDRVPTIVESGAGPDGAGKPEAAEATEATKEQKAVGPTKERKATGATGRSEAPKVTEASRKKSGASRTSKAVKALEALKEMGR